jgi:hypothetical protein
VVCHLFIDCKKWKCMTSGEVLYNTSIEFGVTMKLFRLIKVCLNGRCSEA